MNVAGGIKRALASAWGAVRLLLGRKASAEEADRFICPACHTMYRRQHYQCPQCGEMVVVPLEDEGSLRLRGGFG